MKKLNVLKKIEPLKYNELFSIHNKKAFSRERKNNLPMINHFSRNFTNTMNKTSYLYNTYADSNNNKTFRNFFPNNKNNKPKNFKKISFLCFKLKNYLKSSNFKNKKKLNIQSHSNKINEITFNINSKEYNSSESKYYSIDLKRTKVSLTKDKNYIKNIHTSEKFQKEKDEFYNIINNSPITNDIINDFSHRIYCHIFPGENSDFKYIVKNGRCDSENKISNNLDKKKSYTILKSNLYKKNNVFLEMILEKVMHMVEYKNQLNQEISINLVKNLLIKEINSMKNNLNNKKNIYNFIKIAQDIEINNDISKNDSKYEFKDIISKNNENYFQDSFKNESYALTDREYVIKKRNKYKSDEDNNLGQYIISVGKDINENLKDFKNKDFANNDKLNPKISNMKNMINKFLIGENNKKKYGLHHFNTIKFKEKKNIDINNFKNRMIELYQKYLLYKEYIKEKEINKQNKINNENQNISYDKNISNILKSFVDKTTNTNFEEEEKLKEINRRINQNMSINDLFAIIEGDEEFETFVNGFGGYYSFGDGKKNIKEILKQIKDSNYNILSFKLMKNKDNNKSINNYKNSNYTLYSTNYNQFVDKALESLNKKSSNSNNKKMRNTFSNSNDKRNKLRNKKNILDEKINNKIDLNLFIQKEEDNKSILNEDSKKNSPEKEENKSSPSKSPSRTKNKKRMKKDKEKEKDKKKDKKKELITEEVKSFFRTIKKNTFSLNTIYRNGDLNELEKELLSQTNDLKSLSSKDREQILKYLNELEQALENERNGTNNLYNKIKIKNLHYKIYQYILDLYNRNLLNPQKKTKNSKDILALLKKFNFDESFVKTVNSEDEEDEKEEIGIVIGHENEEIDNLFKINGKNRSHSLDIIKLRGYYKLYHNLLFKKIKNIKRFNKLKSAQKSWRRDEWSKFIAKKEIKNKPKFKKKKRKKYDGRNRLMAYEKLHIPLEHFFREDEEIRKIKEKQRIKNLKKQMTEKKMKEFFRKIQRLKDETLKDYEKELKLLVDEQLDRIDYAKSKENESRVNNFIQDLDYSRNKEICSKIFYSQRMHFVSPIIFFTKKNESNEKKWYLYPYYL